MQIAYANLKKNVLQPAMGPVPPAVPDLPPCEKKRLFESQFNCAPPIRRAPRKPIACEALLLKAVRMQGAANKWLQQGSPRAHCPINALGNGSLFGSSHSSAQLRPLSFPGNIAI